MTQPEEQDDPRLKVLEAYIAYRALQHADDQEHIAAALALALYPIWAIQRFTELDASTPLWLAAAVPKVETAYLQSQRVAGVFAEDVRAASLPTEPPLQISYPNVQQPTGVPSERFHSIPILVDLSGSGIHYDPLGDGLTEPGVPSLQRVDFSDFPAEDVATSLAIQGNYGIKANMPMPEDEAMYSGLSNSSGAGVRQAMNGGRNAITNISQQDRKFLGYARVTDANPCYFCALLASRGTVYGKASFKATNKKFKVNKDAPDLPPGYLDIAKVHDHCKCQLRPVYANADKWDADAADYKQQWEDLTRKWYWLNNKQQIEKWREEYVPHDRSNDLASVTDIRQSLLDRASALQDRGYSRSSPQVSWAEYRANQLAA